MWFCDCRWILRGLASLAVLSGCVADSPAPRLGGAGYVPVELGGNNYRVYTEPTRNCVEVHRVNPVFPPPSRLEILMQMEQAAKQATGCKIRKGTFIGDQAISKGQLDCSDAIRAQNWGAGSCR